MLPPLVLDASLCAWYCGESMNPWVCAVIYGPVYFTCSESIAPGLEAVLCRTVNALCDARGL